MAKRYRDVRRLLRRAGWRTARIEGSHEIWESSDGSDTVTIPGGGKDNREVPTGTLASISSSDRTEGAALTEYVVIYELAADGGWGAYSPDLPGAIAAGETRQEVERNRREAIRIHLDELRLRGRPIPKPRNFAGTVTI